MKHFYSSGYRRKPMAFTQLTTRLKAMASRVFLFCFMFLWGLQMQAQIPKGQYNIVDGPTETDTPVTFFTNDLVEGNDSDSTSSPAYPTETAFTRLFSGGCPTPNPFQLQHLGTGAAGITPATLNDPVYAHGTWAGHFVTVHVEEGRKYNFSMIGTEQRLIEQFGHVNNGFPAGAPFANISFKRPQVDHDPMITLYDNTGSTGGLQLSGNVLAFNLDASPTEPLPELDFTATYTGEIYVAVDIQPGTIVYNPGTGPPNVNIPSAPADCGQFLQDSTSLAVTFIPSAPTLASATRDSDTQITAIFDANVATNGGNPTDFTVTDGIGTNFPVSTQADGTAGDAQIILTVANLSSAIGDLTVTYTDNNNEISDVTDPTAFGATSSVQIDVDTSPPTLSSATKDSDTQLTITLSELVQTSGTNPTDFTVVDGLGTNFAVSAQADGTAGDDQIVLTVADLSGASNSITVTYTNNNGEISDFGGNDLATDATGVSISITTTTSVTGTRTWEYQGGGSFLPAGPNPGGLDILTLPTATERFGGATLGDLDGDGDLDFISGSRLGELYYYQNNGTSTNPNWETGTIATLDTIKIGKVQPINELRPNLYDIDSDGDLDLLVGSRWDYAGNLKFDEVVYFKNIGNSSTPIFQFTHNTTLGLNNIQSIITNNRVSMQNFSLEFGYLDFVDLDGDGDHDLVYNISDNFVFFKNTGTNTVPFFTIEPEATDPFDPDNGFSNISLLASTSVFADFDNDNDFDLYFQDEAGFIKVHENTGTATNPVFNTASQSLGSPVGTTDHDAFGTLDFGDINGDGVLDIITSRFNPAQWFWYAGVSTAPLMVNATKDSETQITVTFSETIQTNGTNPTDFVVTDGLGTTFAVSAQTDATAGDTDIVITVADLSAAIGDLRLTYINNNDEVTGIGSGEAVETNATGVAIDADSSVPTLVSATKNSDTQITITLSEKVQTGGTNPTDFTVTDGLGNNFAVSAQVDGTAQDTDIVLTVADLSGAVGDLKVTYTNNNNEISDFGGNNLATDGTGVDIDTDTTLPTIVSAIQNSTTQITVTLSEKVQTNGANPTDFTVVDGIGTNFAVSAQADGTANDTDIVLTVADLSGAVGDLKVTYTNNNNEISDFGGNSLATDATGASIDSDTTAPTLASAAKASDTEITLTFSEPVFLEGAGVKDGFTVTDGLGSTYSVSNISDGTANDTELTLTVSSLASLVGDLNVTFDAGVPEDRIFDFGANSLATNATGANIDTDATDPTMVSGVRDSDKQLTITFSEAVQIIGDTPDDWTVTDATNTTFAVSQVTDGIAKDDKLILTVADFGAATGPLTVTYQVDCSDISDFGGNALQNDATGIDIQLLPSIAFSAISSNGAESAGSADLQVSLDGSSTQTVSVDYTVTGTAAGSGTDYTLADGTLNITVGDASGNISIASIVDDTLDEENETVIVTLSNPNNAVLGTNTVHTYTITDNDDAPAVAFSATSSNGGESTSSADLSVALSAVSAKEVTVNYAITGTATGSGTDFTLADGTLTITAGNAGNNITIASIVDDALDEVEETVIVTLSSPSNATLGTNQVHTYTINDDDATPDIAFSSSSSSAAETTTSANLEVALSAVSGQDVLVDYTITGTATGSGTDYTLADGTLTITAGNASENITIASIAGDALDEDDETVIVTLSNPTNATLGTNQVHTYTILDDDATPTVAFSSTGSNADEATASVDLQVALSAVSGRGITVNYTVTGTATGSGTDYTLADGTLTISAGDANDNITIAGIVDDALDEADETVIVTLSSPVNASLGTNQVHTYSINDNDVAPTVEFGIASDGQAESEPSQDLPIGLSAVSGKTITVDYVATGTATGGGTDYTFADGTFTFDPGDQNLTLQLTGIIEDALDEDDETIILTLSNPSNATLGTQQTLTYTITDNDATPTVTLSTGAGSIDEASGSTSITATLSAVSGRDVEVDLAYSGTATNGTDYDGAASTSITINAGNTSADATVGLTATQDSDPEGDETIIIDIVGVTNATEDGTQQQTVTLVDDDAPVVSNVTSSTSDGTYKAGDQVLVEITFTQAVNVTGTPQLTLETGTTDQRADYSSGSGSATLVFTYTIQSGDESSDLDYLTTGSLGLNGGTIQNSGSIDAVLTLPGPGTNGSLGDNKAIVIDTEAPAAPEVSSLTDDTGLLADDAITNDNELSFSGTAEANSTVEVFINTTSIGTTNANGSGDWTFDHSGTALADDTYSVTAKATDAVGNTSAASSEFALIVDTTAPDAPVVAGISDDTGASGDDEITNDNTPDVNGTAEANSTVEVFVDNNSVGTTTADDSGNWTMPYNGSSPADDGGLSITATATDAAGNTSNESNALLVTIDTTEPTNVFLPPIEEDDIINSAEEKDVVITGLTSGVEDGQEVSITFTDNVNTPIETTATVSGNAWSTGNIDVSSLADGNIRVTADVADLAGNNAETMIADLVLDTAAPDAPVVSSISNDSGTDNADTITNDDTPEVSGSAEANSSVEVFVDGMSIGSVAADASGNWTMPYNGDSPLVDGVLMVTASAIDEAGNVSEESTALSVTIDTTAPTAPTLDLLASSDLGVSNSDDLTSDITPTVEGTTEANAIVEVFVDDSSMGTTNADASGNWSFTIQTDWADGIYNITARATDIAGNTGDASTGLDLTLDLSLAISTTSPADNETDVLPNANLTLTFDKNVVKGTGNVTIKQVSDDTVIETIDVTGGNVTVSGAEVTIDPVDNILPPDTEFYVSIDEGAFENEAGAPFAGISDNSTFSFTIIAASVVSSVDVPTDGTYMIGDNLDFTVNMILPISISGTATIPLTIGSTTVNASQVGAVSNSNTILFRYTIVEDDLDTDGITVGRAMNLNGGTMRDQFDVDAILTLNSVANTAGVLVDGVKPTPSITSTAVDLVNGTFSATITYDEAVENFVVTDLTVVNGTAGNLVNTTTGTTWTVDITPTADGEVSVSLAANTANDQAGNGSNASNTVTRDFDGTAPVVVSLNRTGIDPVNTGITELGYRLIFSEEVTGVDLSDLEVVLTGTATGNLSTVMQVDAITYDITVDGIGGQGTIGVNVKTDDSIIDAAANPLGSTFAGQVYTTNFIPTDIGLSVSAIDENNTLTEVVAAISTTDADAGDSHTYTLVAGTGDTDNTSFTIDGTNLRANNVSFNFEDQSSYALRLMTDDGKGGTFEKAFTITVNDLNEVPSMLSLSNNSIDEDDNAQDVGMLVTLDQDGGDTFTYTLVSGTGDEDNAEFEISGNTLRTAGLINFEDGTTRSILVRVTDSGGLTLDQQFTINIDEVVIEPLRDYETNIPGGAVRNIFSPNGDGVNETWVIEDLLDNPVNEVKVYAQGGKLIFSQVNYQNDWDGTFKGDPIPDGTYYYEINVYDGERIIKGFLTIVRNR